MGGALPSTAATSCLLMPAGTPAGAAAGPAAPEAAREGPPGADAASTSIGEGPLLLLPLPAAAACAAASGFEGPLADGGWYSMSMRAKRSSSCLSAAAVGLAALALAPACPEPAEAASAPSPGSATSAELLLAPASGAAPPAAAPVVNVLDEGAGRKGNLAANCASLPNVEAALPGAARCSQHCRRATGRHERVKRRPWQPGRAPNAGSTSTCRRQAWRAVAHLSRHAQQHLLVLGRPCAKPR